MRNRRFQFEPIRVDLSREEIMADLLYPAPASDAAGRRTSRRERPRRTPRRSRR